MKQNERTIKRMDWWFYASFILAFLGLGLAFAGLIARHYEPPARWGIWCSVLGWTIFISSIALRWWVKRWFRRLRQ
jgi:hypothetical protein